MKCLLFLFLLLILNASYCNAQIEKPSKSSILREKQEILRELNRIQAGDQEFIKQCMDEIKNGLHKNRIANRSHVLLRNVPINKRNEIFTFYINLLKKHKNTPNRTKLLTELIAFSKLCEKIEEDDRAFIKTAVRSIVKKPYEIPRNQRYTFARILLFNKNDNFYYFSGLAIIFTMLADEKISQRFKNKIISSLYKLKVIDRKILKIYLSNNLQELSKEASKNNGPPPSILQIRRRRTLKNKNKQSLEIFKEYNSLLDTQQQNTLKHLMFKNNKKKVDDRIFIISGYKVIFSPFPTSTRVTTYVKNRVHGVIAKGFDISIKNNELIINNKNYVKLKPNDSILIKNNNLFINGTFVKCINKF